MFKILLVSCSFVGHFVVQCWNRNRPFHHSRNFANSFNVVHLGIRSAEFPVPAIQYHPILSGLKIDNRATYVLNSLDGFCNRYDVIWNPVHTKTWFLVDSLRGLKKNLFVRNCCGNFSDSICHWSSYLPCKSIKQDFFISIVCAVAFTFSFDKFRMTRCLCKAYFVLSNFVTAWWSAVYFTPHFFFSIHWFWTVVSIAVLPFYPCNI